MIDLNELQHKEYIGDGVYAGFDGFQIWIWTSNGIRNSEPIALEPTAFRALADYAKRLGWRHLS